LRLLFGAQRRHRIHHDAVDALFEQRVDVLHLFAGIEVAVAKHEVTGAAVGGVTL
jgi:hypothetical protein